MRNRYLRTVALLASVVAWSAASWPLEATAAQRYKWWQSTDVQAEIGLTEDQGTRIEAIFQDLRPTLREQMHRLNREEKELSQLMHAMVAEEWEVALQIDQMEAARSALSKTRTLMLYRMHKVLKQPQIEALHDLWEREGHGQGHHGTSSGGSGQH